MYRPVLGGNIVNDNTSVRVFDVTGNERLIALLPSSIPELQPDSFVVNLQGLGQKVDSDSGLHHTQGTASVSL